MIQRKQTLFLLAALIAVMVCSCMSVGTLTWEGMGNAKVYNLWIADGQGHYNYSVWPMLGALILSATLSIVTIFMYTKRKLQASLCLVNMLVLVIWGVLLAVMPTMNGGNLLLSWPVVLPMAAIVFLVLARKGIMADEKLVRSLDRIR